VTAIVAKTPMRPEANYAEGAFVRVESKSPKCMAHRPAQEANDARPKASGVASREPADLPTRRPSWMCLSFLLASFGCVTQGVRQSGGTMSRIRQLGPKVAFD